MNIFIWHAGENIQHIYSQNFFSSQEQSSCAKCSGIKEEPMNTTFACDGLLFEEHSENSVDNYEDLHGQNLNSVAVG